MHFNLKKLSFSYLGWGRRSSILYELDGDFGTRWTNQIEHRTVTSRLLISQQSSGEHSKGILAVNIVLAEGKIQKGPYRQQGLES